MDSNLTYLYLGRDKLKVSEGEVSQKLLKYIEIIKLIYWILELARGKGS